MKPHKRTYIRFENKAGKCIWLPCRDFLRHKWWWVNRGFYRTKIRVRITEPENSSMDLRWAICDREYGKIREDFGE